MRVDVDYEERALSMPCDPDLLADLGRVTWAASRLHCGVRDALNHISARAGEEHDASSSFDASLGGVITQLQKRAAQLPKRHRDALTQWCQDLGHAAAELRNGVAHAITYTASDGKQALGGWGADRPRRYGRTELLDVAGHLVAASAALPPGPYR